MRVTRDMVIFDANLPFAVRLAGYTLGFTLTIAVHIASVISAFVAPTPHNNPDSRHGRISRGLKRLISEK